MTPKDILTNRNFCPMPWTGLMYNVDGSVKNCIRSAGVLGNIKDNTIQEILSNDINCGTQQRMLDQQPGPHCHPCYELENNKAGFEIISDRIFYIRELKKLDLSTYDTVGYHDLKTIDVRWSNLCNFGCVYCGPNFSSRWADELEVAIKQPSLAQLTQFKQYIFDHAKNLKHVYLAGGEPLLMKENLELLQILQTQNPTVNIRVNTNLSVTNTRVFEKICEFENVHWTISVETMNDEFEYIRYGGKWNDFATNLKQIVQLGHRITFNMLWFLLNYQSIFDCVDWLKLQGFHNNSFVIGALLTPEYLNIRHLPEHVLQLLKLQLENKISQGPGYLLEDSYRNMLNYVQRPFEKNLDQSLDQLRQLDQRRGIDSSKIFTELYKLREEN
jgi:sulfatase maturation enzyme AslB (radical SAM superfamily)